MQSLKCDIVAIERSDPRHGESLEVRSMEKTYPRRRTFDDRVRHGDPHASSKASLTSSSAKCAEVKKIDSESCGQVNVTPAESFKENSPDVPSMPHRRSRRSRE